MKDKELFSKFMSLIEKQGTKAECTAIFPPRIRFSGDDDFLVWKARNAVTEHKTLFVDLAEHLGIKDELMRDMGTEYIRAFHMRHVYGSVVCPLDQFEEDMSYYWRERQGMCYADRLPDSFMQVWYLNMQSDMCESYWNQDYSINPLYVHSAAKAKANVYGGKIFMDIRGAWHVLYPASHDGQAKTEREEFNRWRSKYEIYDRWGIGWRGKVKGDVPAMSWELLPDEDKPDAEDDILNGVSGMSKQ